MDNLPDNIYFKDAGGGFARVNKALTAYLGLADPGQAIGKTDSDFFAAEHARERRTGWLLAMYAALTRTSAHDSRLRACENFTHTRPIPRLH